MCLDDGSQGSTMDYPCCACAWTKRLKAWLMTKSNYCFDSITAPYSQAYFCTSSGACVRGLLRPKSACSRRRSTGTQEVGAVIELSRCGAVSYQGTCLLKVYTKLESTKVVIYAGRQPCTCVCVCGKPVLERLSKCM